MGLTCNINRTGRLIRGLVGIILIADAILMYAYDLPSNGTMSRVLQIVVAALGLFALFEAAIGWCAARALGAKTRF